MKTLAHLSLLTLILSIAAPVAAESEGTNECSTDDPLVAQGTAIDYASGEEEEKDEAGEESRETARELATRRALETATSHCAGSDGGEPVFVSIDARQDGAVATATVRFFCSESC